MSRLEPTAHTLYLSSTPLHSFFALGLMNGAFAGGAHTLALIDQQHGARDYIADALRARSNSSLAVHRFEALGASASARRVLHQVSALSRSLQPSRIAVGNDCRIEFYAAMRGCPSARRVYIDDGLYSYLAHQNAKPAWREALSNGRRALKYGLSLERPSKVGGSRAVEEGYVLLPPRVHAGLTHKPVHALQPAWFAAAATREVCLAAAALAGFDAARCASIRLLVLLPHPRFLHADGALSRRIEALAAGCAARGEGVAIKPHPHQQMPIHELLPALPADVLELPARLPVEVLLPLLSGTLVVGALTTALLTLRLLGHELTVRNLSLPTSSAAGSGFEHGVVEIYESVGIGPLDETAAG